MKRRSAAIARRRRRSAAVLIVAFSTLSASACSLSAPTLGDYAKDRPGAGGVDGSALGGTRGGGIGGATPNGMGGSAGRAEGGGAAGVTAGGSNAASGSSGASGSGGSGEVVIGPGCAALPVAVGSHPLIDDFEDHDGVIAGFEQRSGSWFTYNDMSGGAQLPVGARPQPAASDRGYSMNTSGSGFKTWGAGVGFVINKGCPYDASVYQGFKFYLKGSVNSADSLALRVRIAATTPAGDGGTCTANCFDHYSLPVDVSAAWTEISVPWTRLSQSGFGAATPFQANAIIGASFEIGANQTFDVWVDDLKFF